MTKNTNKPDFEQDLAKLTSKLMDDKYAVAMYCALSNMKWKHKNLSKPYSCSFRYAAGLIAKLRDKGETYLDFYCSGMEGEVTGEISLDLHAMGWKERPWPGRKKK